MHWAADGGHTACCITLREIGADYGVKSAGGVTPLHNAAAGGHDECFLALVKMGASVNVLDNVCFKFYYASFCLSYFSFAHSYFFFSLFRENPLPYITLQEIIEKVLWSCSIVLALMTLLLT